MRLLRSAAALLLGSLSQGGSVIAQDTAVKMESEQIEGPTCAGLPEWYSRQQPRTCTEGELKIWLTDVRNWRMERRIRVGLNDAEYLRPELAWTQSSFVQPQLMVHDRFFYDTAKQQYTIDRYLADTVARYGGIDSVLVWPTYPNIGIDDRNQYDLFHDMPGGIAGVKSFVDAFHRKGVKVMFPTMLWDQGTRMQGEPDAEALSKELIDAGADGINGDTLQGMPMSFRNASDKLGRPLALEPELGPSSDEMLNYNNMTWGYWKYDFVPTLSRYKWLEPRHMVHISNRWQHDHTDDLQHAFFNGIGFESWENIWGIWNQMTPRDAEALRRISKIDRAQSKLLGSSAWEPHGLVRNFGVFTSKWPGADDTALWTIVNRNHYAVSGRQLTVPHTDGLRYFDLWNGVELKPNREGQHDVLRFSMESDGFGAVLAISTAPSKELVGTLREMKKLAEKPLNSYSHEWKVLPQHVVAVATTKPTKAIPVGMKAIPSANFVFRINGVEIEGTNDDGVDVQYAGEASPRRYHEVEIQIPAFYIDTYEVTNAEFKKFLDATHYKPADDHNFLKNWANGMAPAGAESLPVTWVSIEDARTYAAWAGKRLPREWEWQYAAQGNDGREYPWGNTWIAANAPTPDTGRVEQSAADVHAHPSGASPFGVEDMVGNVWQWTDEWTDEHTRAAILRGGSHYIPSGSRWYFPQAYKLSQHGKYLLMAPSLDRSASIGFRCVVDTGI